MTRNSAGPRRPLWQVVVVLLLGLFMLAGFLWLGFWQVERLGWKRDLIARVDARVHAAPVDWTEAAGMAPQELEYRRVTATGTFDHGNETLVQAVTELGGGFWVLTPLRTETGETILINRGFVPPDRRDPASRTEGQLSGVQTVTGLARLTEPEGAFLRSNDPAADRWYSRDVVAIATKLGLDNFADFFIDAEAMPLSGGYPVGGLTVISFRNTHLSYALTWFALAALVAIGIGILIRHELALRRGVG